MPYDSYRDWPAYQRAFRVAMRVHELTKPFPAEERVGMVEPMRLATRAVCAALADAWRRRKYRARFVAVLTDAEAKAESARVWVELAGRCEYLRAELQQELDGDLQALLAEISRLAWEPDYWHLPSERVPDPPAGPPIPVAGLE